MLLLIRCGLLLLAILSSVQPKDFHRDGLLGVLDNDYNKRFSLWPSVHNAAIVVRNRRAIDTGNNLAPESPAVSTDTQGASEGIGGEANQPNNSTKPIPLVQLQPSQLSKDQGLKQIPPPADDPLSKNSSTISNNTPKATATEASVAPPVTPAVDNGTTVEKTTKQWDLSNPEATKRGLIVFGGFALLAMAYFIFYRTKSKFNEAGNTNGTNESNQFRYGVLQSDDRSNLELSRVPLTMESDEEEDEDLEIFDLGQKKKSLSYVNLQGRDEDIVLSARENDGREDLLLDIDDDNSDILINWSNDSKKMLS